jgi:ABC-type lipoprotein release transport system permease subunit
VSAIRARIAQFDRDIAISQVYTLPQLIERASWQDRFLAVLFMAFAALALTLAAVGLAIGVASALALTRLLQSQLFEISAMDPVTYVVTPLVLMSVAMLAAFVPARRATLVDPVTALRWE